MLRGQAHSMCKELPGLCPLFQGAFRITPSAVQPGYGLDSETVFLTAPISLSLHARPQGEAVSILYCTCDRFTTLPRQ